MREPRVNVAVHLSPGRLDAAAWHRSGVRTASRQWATRDTTRPTEADLAQSQALLSEVISELGVRRGAAVVLIHGYGSGRAVVQRAPSPALATANARTALLDELEDGRGDILIAAAPLHTPGDDGAGDSLGLACGEAEAFVDSLWRWAEGTGLKPVRCLIARTVEIAMMVDRVTTPGSDESKPWCVIGRRRTMFAAGGTGRVAYVRSIEIGIDALINAYSQAIAAASFTGVDLPPHSGADPTELAQRLLRSHGLPSRDDRLGETGLRGIDVLPLLQPVVHRLCGELRQTLRFGPRDTAASASCLMLGLPMPVPSLGDTLAVQIELPVAEVTTDEDDPGRDLLEAARQRWAALPGLQPRRVSQRRQARMGRVVTLTGMLVATSLLALDLYRAGSERRRLDLAIAQAEASAEVAGEIRAAYDDSLRLAKRLAILRSVSASLLAERPVWARCLDALAEAGGSGIEIGEIDGVLGRGSAHMNIAGTANASDGVTPEQRLRRFIAELSAGDVFTAVELVSVEAEASANDPASRFVIRVEPRLYTDAPPELLADGRAHGP